MPLCGPPSVTDPCRVLAIKGYPEEWLSIGYSTTMRRASVSGPESIPVPVLQPWLRGVVQHQLEEDENLIDYKSKKTSAIRLAFFPNGRREHTRATLLTADLLFQRAQPATTIHVKPSRPSSTPRCTLAFTPPSGSAAPAPGPATSRAPRPAPKPSTTAGTSPCASPMP